MKKIVSSVLCIVMLILMFPEVSFALAPTFHGVITYDGAEHNYSGTKFRIYVNGKKVETPIPPIVIENGRSLVPVREICEALGTEVLWSEGENGSGAKILICSDEKVIGLEIDKKVATVNGVEVKIDSAPKLIGYNGIGKTMVPIRFISETLNLSVDYIATEGYIMIDGYVQPTSKPTPTETPTPSVSPETSETPDKTPETELKGYVTSLEYAHGDGRDTVELKFSSEPGEYNILELSNPTRLVVDFEGFSVSKLKSSYSSEGEIDRIRTGDFEGSARFVFDVKTMPKYMVIVDEDSKRVQIRLVFDESVKEDDEVPDDAPTVIIDAGHGGSDPGAIGKDENGKTIVYEKTINLAISKLVVKKLREEGINAVFTRDSDVYWELAERTDFANELEADLFVSIHCNALTDETVSGTLVMHHTSNEYADTGKLLASNIMKYLPDAWGIANKGRVDGSKMYVIRKANMPSVIVENAFITNEGDREKLMDEELQEKAAEAICKGIIKTLEEM